MGSTAARGLTFSVALRLGRVSNLPTVWTNVLAGAVLSGAPLEPAPVAALMLALSLFYVAGMYLNDGFDAAYDAVHRPGRPIPSGAVSKRAVFAIGGTMIAGGLVVLAAVGLAGGRDSAPGLAGGLALSLAIVVYDAWHKGNPVSPVIMGLCRVLVYVTVAATLTGGLAGVTRPGLLTGAAIALCYLIGLTYAAKQEDLKQPGRLWPLAFLAAPFVVFAPAALDLSVALPIWLALAAATAYALSFMLRPGRSNIPRVVSTLIAGICLLDGLFIAAAGQPLLALAACAGFPLTLVFQRRIPGT